MLDFSCLKNKNKAHKKNPNWETSKNSLFAPSILATIHDSGKDYGPTSYFNMFNILTYVEILVVFVTDFSGSKIS